MAALAEPAHSLNSLRMRDLTRPSDPSAGGYARIMAVFAAVARHGPLGLEAAMRHTGLPRSACWRCLTTLESEGWIRRVLGGARFVASAPARSVLGGVPPLPDGLDRVAHVLSDLLKGKDIRADIAGFAGMGAIRVLETNRPAEARAPDAEDLLTSPLGLALLMVCSAETRLAHVRAAMATAPPETVQTVTSGKFTRTLSQAARDGSVWEAGLGALSVPLVFADTVLALRLESDGSTRRSENRLRGVADRIGQHLPGVLRSPAEIERQFWPARAPRRGE